MEKDKKFLGTEPVGKLLLQLALPTVAAQLINMLYNIVDRIYIGHIPGEGAMALTGVGVCMPIIMIVSAFAALVGYGGSPRASIAMGKGDQNEAEEILGNCLVLQVILSAILTAVLLIWNRDFLMTFGASENTIGYAVSYMNIYALGTIFVQLTLGMNSFITAQGFARTGMLSVLIGAVCNIILDPILIFGFHMGVPGAAWATIISQGLSGLFCLLFIWKKFPLLHISKEDLTPKLCYIRTLLGMGLPMGLQTSITAIGSILLQASVNGLGSIAVASVTTASKIYMFFSCAYDAFGVAISTYGGQNIGANKPKRARTKVLHDCGHCVFNSRFSHPILFRQTSHAVVCGCQ